MSIPINPQSVAYAELDPWIRADVDAAIKRSAEYSKRMREIVEAEASRKTTDRPVIKQFSETYNDAVRSIQMADPSLTLEQAHERATIKTMAEARAARFATMADPSTDPTPLAPAQQQEFDALDENLLSSAVTYAQRTAITNAPKQEKPELGYHYKAAIELISRSPDLSRDAALKLARDAMAKDRAELIARNAAASNPSPPGGLVGTVI